MAQEIDSLKKKTIGSIRNDLIAPTVALIETSAVAGKVWTKNFLETNFTYEVKEDGSADFTKPMKARMVECAFEVMKNGTVGTATMKVPLLSIAPTPFVALSMGKLVHDYEVNVLEEDTDGGSMEMTQETSGGVNVPGFGSATARMSFTATANKERRRTSDARAAIHIEQEFTQIPLSEGFLRLQEQLLGAATV
jgi:hypothetical protein